MKNANKFFGIVAFVAMIVFGIIACGDPGSTPGDGGSLSRPTEPEAMSGKTAMQYFKNDECKTVIQRMVAAITE